MRTIRILFLALTMAIAPAISSCTPAQLAGLKVANTIANGVACGMAAANDTPCTPTAVLEALAKHARAQRETVEAVAPQAAAVDPELTKTLMAQLAENTKSNQRIAEAIVLLAARQPVETPPASASSPAPAPPLPPAPTTLPAPAPVPAPAPSSP